MHSLINYIVLVLNAYKNWPDIAPNRDLWKSKGEAFVQQWGTITGELKKKSSMLIETRYRSVTNIDRLTVCIELKKFMWHMKR